MLVSIAGAGLAKSKATMLQTEGGYDTCARKRIEIAEHMRYLPMGYYSAIKGNAFESVLMKWMNLESIIQSEVSQKEKDKYCILMHIYGI